MQLFRTMTSKTQTLFSFLCFVHFLLTFLIQFYVIVYTAQLYRILPYLKTVKYVQEGGEAVDVLDRLHKLMDARSWTMYRLAKESGLTESTIANIYRRNAIPSIDTLEKICQGFGITLSQFFSDAEMVELTDELKEVFENWRTMTPEQKEAALTMMRAFNHDK